LEINLEKGLIDFEALNEGFAAPNTAELQVYDDKGRVIALVKNRHRVQGDNNCRHAM
jgi:hypothetical protein